MNGMFFVQLQQYVAEHIQPHQWKQILHQAEISENKLYFSGQQYDEEEFFKIIKESAKFLEMSREKFLNGFGIFISSNFLKFCQPVIKASWKTLDLLEHIQEFNFKLLQVGDNPDMSGKFITKRLDQDTVSIHYSSPRKLCPAFKGLIKGISDCYNEKVTIKEPQCALDGHSQCEFLVTLGGYK